MFSVTIMHQDHYFTPLLILAVLEPAYEHSLMAKALLMAKADPSSRVDPEYRYQYQTISTIFQIHIDHGANIFHKFCDS